MLELYKKRNELLFQKGIEKREIVPFDDEFYNNLKNTFVSSIPAYINVKYFNYAMDIDERYSKVFQIFMSFKNSKLVSGKTKYFDDEYEDYSWVEIDDYVFDAYLMMKFKKDLYYKIISPKNIVIYDHVKYREKNKEMYDDIINTTIKDFYPNGSKNHNLLYEIPNAITYAEMTKNIKLLNELNEYLYKIKYNRIEITKEINAKALTLK